VALTAIGLLAVAELNMREEPYVSAATKYLIDNVKTFEDARIAIAGFEAIVKRPPDEVARKWLDTSTKMQNKGLYGMGDGMVRDTGSVIAMKLRLGFPVDAKAACRTALANGQREDGAFGKAGAKGSDLETTYRVMRAIYMLGEKPKDAEKLKVFVGRCRNADGGYSVEPGKPSTVGATYFAGMVLYWLK
jgi:hypothetical protein